MKLLHLDSSILGDQSVSRQLSGSIVNALRAGEQSIDITARDLAADPLPHLTVVNLPGADAAVRAELDQFLAADVVVIGAPMYNFTLPSQLKAWIDRIIVAGETFSYSESGPMGLAGGKRVIIALSRGGHYSTGTPAEGLEHLETYLRAVFGFIGIVPEFIAADGIAIGPEQRSEAIKRALAQVSTLAA